MPGSPDSADAFVSTFAMEFSFNPAIEEMLRYGRAAIRTTAGVDAIKPRTRCDCPGCQPPRLKVTMPAGMSHDSPLRVAYRRMIAAPDFRRLAGLNTPDRKQMGVAQTRTA